MTRYALIIVAALGATLIVAAVAQGRPTVRTVSAPADLCPAAGRVQARRPRCATTHVRTQISVGGVLGTVTSPVKSAVGDVGGTLLGAGTKAVATAGLVVFGSWITTGAVDALKATARIVGSSTEPHLGSTWFSSAYWRVAGVAALLTVPFLFAAAIQSLLRADLTLLARAAFGYLPLGMLAVAVAGPITMLLLSASDEMSTIVSSASGQAGESFFGHLSHAAANVSSVTGSPFVAVVVGVLTVAAALALWLELLIRESAVYVIVLMLPLFFAALVWPARRVWAARAVELLVALILSKFTIVAVLALGGAAIANGGSAAAALAGVTLVLLAVLTPWGVLRLLPLHEVAAAAAGNLRPIHVEQVRQAVEGLGSGSSSAIPDSSPGLPRASSADESSAPETPRSLPQTSTSDPRGADVAPTTDGSSGSTDEPVATPEPELAAPAGDAPGTRAHFADVPGMAAHMYANWTHDSLDVVQSSRRADIPVSDWKQDATAASSPAVTPAPEPNAPDPAEGAPALPEPETASAEPVLPRTEESAL